MRKNNFLVLVVISFFSMNVFGVDKIDSNKVPIQTGSFSEALHHSYILRKNIKDKLRSKNSTGQANLEKYLINTPKMTDPPSPRDWGTAESLDIDLDDDLLTIPKGKSLASRNLRLEIQNGIPLLVARVPTTNFGIPVWTPIMEIRSQNSSFIINILQQKVKDIKSRKWDGTVRIPWCNDADHQPNDVMLESLDVESIEFHNTDDSIAGVSFILDKKYFNPVYLKSSNEFQATSILLNPNKPQYPDSAFFARAVLATGAAAGCIAIIGLTAPFMGPIYLAELKSMAIDTLIDVGVEVGCDIAADLIMSYVEQMINESLTKLADNPELKEVIEVFSFVQENIDAVNNKLKNDPNFKKQFDIYSKDPYALVTDIALYMLDELKAMAVANIAQENPLNPKDEKMMSKEELAEYNLRKEQISNVIDDVYDNPQKLVDVMGYTALNAAGVTDDEIKGAYETADNIFYGNDEAKFYKSIGDLSEAMAGDKETGAYFRTALDGAVMLNQLKNEDFQGLSEEQIRDQVFETVADYAIDKSVVGKSNREALLGLYSANTTEKAQDMAVKLLENNLPEEHAENIKLGLSAAVALASINEKASVEDVKGYLTQTLTDAIGQKSADAINNLTTPGKRLEGVGTLLEENADALFGEGSKPAVQKVYAYYDGVSKLTNPNTSETEFKAALVKTVTDIVGDEQDETTKPIIDTAQKIYNMTGKERLAAIKNTLAVELEKMARQTVGATRYDQISDTITELENSPVPSQTALNMLTSKEVIGQDNLDTIDMVSKTYGYLSNVNKEKMMKDIKDEISTQATEVMNKAFGPDAEAVSASLGKLLAAKNKEGVLNWVNSDLLTKEGAGIILGEQNAKPLLDTINTLDETYSALKKTSLSDIKTQGVKIVTDEITKGMSKYEKTAFNQLTSAKNFIDFQNVAKTQITKAIDADKDLKEAKRIYDMKDPNARNNAIMALAIKTAAGDKAEEFKELATKVEQAKTTKDAIGIIGDNILKGYTGVDAKQIGDKFTEINDWRKNLKDKKTTQAMGEALDFAAENLLTKKENKYFKEAAGSVEIIATTIDKLKEAKANGAPFSQKVTIVANGITQLVIDADPKTKKDIMEQFDNLESALGTENLISTVWDMGKSDPTAIANIGILENMGALVAAAATMNVANLGFEPMKTTIPGVETIWPIKNELWDSSEQLNFVKSPVLRALMGLSEIKDKTENCSIVMTEDGNLLIKERHTNKVLFQTDTAGCTMSDAEANKEYTRKVKVDGKEVDEKYKLVTHDFNKALGTLTRKKVDNKEHLILTPKPYSFAIIDMDNQILEYKKHSNFSQWLAIKGVGMGFNIDSNTQKNVSGDFVISFETDGGQGLKTPLVNIGSNWQNLLESVLGLGIEDKDHGGFHSPPRTLRVTEHIAKYNFYLPVEDLANRSRSKMGSENTLQGGDKLESRSENGEIAFGARLEKDGVINIIKYKHIMDHSWTTYGPKTLMYSLYPEKIFFNVPGFQYSPPYKLIMNKYYVAIVDANGNLAMIYPFDAGRKTEEQKKKIAAEKAKILGKEEVTDADIEKAAESIESGGSEGFDIEDAIRQHELKPASVHIGGNPKSSKKFDWDAAIKRINDDEHSEYHYYEYKGLEKLPANKEFLFDIGVNQRSALYVEEYEKGQDPADQYMEFNFNVGPFIVNNLSNKITMSTTLPYNIHNRNLDTGRMITKRNRDYYDIEGGAIKNGVKDNIFWTGHSRVGSNSGVYEFRDNQRVWNSFCPVVGTMGVKDPASFGEFKFEGISGNIPTIKYYTIDRDTKIPGLMRRQPQDIITENLLNCFPGFRFKIRFIVSGFDVGTRYIGQSPVKSDIVSLRKRLSNGHYFVVNIAKPIIRGGQNGEVTGDLPWDIYKNLYCRVFFTIEDEAGVPVERNYDIGKYNKINKEILNANIKRDSQTKEITPDNEKK